jgi:hypothetical protein
MTEKTSLTEKACAAVRQDQPATMRELLQSHADLRAAINEPMAAFDSPLITCVRSPEMLDVLLAAGAEINARSRWWAGGFGLLDRASPHLSDYAIERGATLDICSAARLGRIEKIKEFVAQDPGLVHARGGDGQTPLHFAASVEIAEYLLGHGADMDARDVDHESTPAQYMVRDRQVIARHLLRRGCHTDILMVAALGDLDGVRKHLRDDPGCIRASVSEEWFPKRNPKSGGTIYNWTLGTDKSAHVIAREFGHEEIFCLLMEHSPAELRLAVACEVRDEAAVTALVATHPNLLQSAAETDHRRIAHAARNNLTDVVRLMLNAGWPPDARGQHGATPLHWAAFHGNAEMVELILRQNPPLEATDQDYRMTPLGWANYGRENGWDCKTGNYPATIDALLRAGAKETE